MFYYLNISQWSLITQNNIVVFGSGLTPEELHITPEGNLLPVWEPVMKDQANNCFTGKFT